MSVTIKDIARRAGVSHSTVSRALRGNPAIAAETTTRIQQLAREMGYVPNTVARGLKTSRSNVIGIIVRRISDPFFGELFHGFEDVLLDHGYSYFISTSNRDADRERAIVRTLSERRVDGVVFCSTAVETEHLAFFRNLGVLTVLINNQAAETMPNSIYHDDEAGARALAEHLLNLGHRRIAYIGNTNGGRTNDDRQRGVAAALAAAGVAADDALLAEGPDGQPRTGAALAGDLLARSARPTALICYNDLMAVGAVRELQRRGLQVPGDCSVTGFDDVELAAYTTPPLTTLRQPKEALGRAAADMMLRLLADDAAEQETVVMQGELIVRESTGPPPTAP